MDGTATTWSPDPDAPVYALATSGSTLYAGGEFIVIAENFRFRLAAFDTNGALTGWNPGVLKSNADAYVLALAAKGSTVFVGGDFSIVGNLNRVNFAAIGADGAVAEWSANADSRVLAIAASDSTVYIGGEFVTVNGKSGKNLAAMDMNGTLSPWDPRANGRVVTLADVKRHDLCWRKFLNDRLLGSQPAGRDQHQW